MSDDHRLRRAIDAVLTEPGGDPEAPERGIPTGWLLVVELDRFRRCRDAARRLERERARLLLGVPA